MLKFRNECATRRYKPIEVARQTDDSLSSAFILLAILRLRFATGRYSSASRCSIWKTSFQSFGGNDLLEWGFKV